MLPGDVFEAAEVDGSSGWSTFWRITLPLLRPTIALAIIFRVLQAFGLFDLPYVMTGGGPGTATQSLSVVVGQAPAITSANATSFGTGTAGSFSVTTTGYPAPSIGESGALPTGPTVSGWPQPARAGKGSER